MEREPDLKASRLWGKLRYNQGFPIMDGRG